MILELYYAYSCLSFDPECRAMPADPPGVLSCGKLVTKQANPKRSSDKFILELKNIGLDTNWYCILKIENTVNFLLAVQTDLILPSSAQAPSKLGFIFRPSPTRDSLFPVFN